MLNNNNFNNFTGQVLEVIAQSEGRGEGLKMATFWLSPPNRSRCELNEPTNFRVDLQQWISVDLESGRNKNKNYYRNVFTAVIRVMKRVRLIFVYRRNCFLPPPGRRLAVLVIRPKCVRLLCANSEINCPEFFSKIGFKVEKKSHKSCS